MADNTFAQLKDSHTVPHLTEYVRVEAEDMRGFQQLAEPPTGRALGQNAGDTVNYTYITKLNVQGGQLSENQDIPVTSFADVKGTYTVQEYGNGTRLTRLVKELSELPVEDEAVAVLVQDMKDVMNIQAHAELADTDWKVVFSSTGDQFYTSNSGLTVSNEDLTLDNLRFVVRQARKRNVPYWDGESFAYVSGVDSIDALAYSDDVKELLREESGRDALNGEIGRVAKCRLIEDNHVVASVPQNTTADQGFLIGADALINEFAIAPEIRYQDSGFGRFQAIAWYFVAAWKRPLTGALHSKEHTIHVTGASA